MPLTRFQQAVVDALKEINMPALAQKAEKNYLAGQTYPPVRGLPSSVKRKIDRANFEISRAKGR